MAGALSGLTGNTGTNVGSSMSCIGRSLLWVEHGDAVTDSNVNWRQVFSFKPETLADSWAPTFYGAFAIAQTFEQLRVKSISSSWGGSFVFYFLGALWATFGYAGNYGVFWGFFITCIISPFTLFLAFRDPTSAE